MLNYFNRFPQQVAILTTNGSWGVMLSKFVLLLIVIAVLPGISACVRGNLVDDTILQGQHRSEAHRARDRYRHPRETLAFFQVEPDMTVVEIWPGGGGWYSEILAPYLKNEGVLYAAHFAQDAKGQFFQISLQQYRQKFKDYPEIYENVVVTELQPPQKFDIAPEATADRVLTFRNVHNWMKFGQAEAVFKAMYKALKPCGMLGVVEHRLPSKAKEDAQALSGYVSERQVLELAAQAGFVLLAKAEINANPKDTADYPAGVWTLPPTLRLGERGRDHYLEIGESDRMTLLFMKQQCVDAKGFF